MKDCKMIVLKIGSALISSDKNLSDKLIKSITGQINALIKKRKTARTTPLNA